jgi:hypothetical protein
MYVCHCHIKVSKLGLLLIFCIAKSQNLIFNFKKFFCLCTTAVYNSCILTCPNILPEMEIHKIGSWKKIHPGIIGQIIYLSKLAAIIISNQ